MKHTFAFILMLALGVSGCTPSRPEDSMSRPCLYNLRIVEAAKGGFSVGTATTNGTPVTVKDLLPFVKASNTTYFTCPRGQPYALGAIGESPRCPLHGSWNEIVSRLKMEEPNTTSQSAWSPASKK